MEFTWAQVLREVGATVHVQKLLCQIALPVDLGDARRIDALATGLPLLWVGPSSVTQRSDHLSMRMAPLMRRRQQMMARAQADMERKYHDVHDSPIAELITLAVELGARWNEAAHGLLRGLAKHKVRNTPCCCAGRRN